MRCYNWNPRMVVNIVNLVLYLVSDVLIPVPVIPVMALFIYLVKLWVIFFSMVATFVIDFVDYQA